MIELDKDFLNLLTYGGTTTSKKIHKAFTKNHNLVLGWKTQEMRATSLELTMNKIEGVDGVHEVVLVLPSSSFLSSPISPPIFSLSSSRVHPCSWGVERERVTNEWMNERVSERVELQLMGCPN